MKLYLDDDSAKTVLVTRLKKAGHDVVIPTDVHLRGASDPRHLLLPSSMADRFVCIGFNGTNCVFSEEYLLYFPYLLDCA
jgi:hypothetical protein